MSHHLLRPLQDDQGGLITDASVSVYQPGTDTPISDPLYSDAGLSAPLSNPFSATLGYVDFYLENAQTVRLGIQRGTDPSTYIEDLDVGAVVPPTPPAPVITTFYVPGALSVADIPQHFYIEEDSTVLYVRATLDAAAVDADLVVDVRADGTSIGAQSDGGAGQIHLVPGGDLSVKTTDIANPAITAGQALTISLTQVGSTTPGSDLTVQVCTQPNS